MTETRGDELAVFVTEDNRARLMAIYDERLRQWPVPFDTFFVDTGYGKTHVIASGSVTSRRWYSFTPWVWAGSYGPRSSRR